MSCVLFTFFSFFYCPPECYVSVVSFYCWTRPRKNFQTTRGKLQVTPKFYIFSNEIISYLCSYQIFILVIFQIFLYYWYTYILTMHAKDSVIPVHTEIMLTICCYLLLILANDILNIWIWNLEIIHILESLLNWAIRRRPLGTKNSCCNFLGNDDLSD